jgi:hypothetical protein
LTSLHGRPTQKTWGATYSFDITKNGDHPLPTIPAMLQKLTLKD